MSRSAILKVAEREEFVSLLGHSPNKHALAAGLDNVSELFYPVFRLIQPFTFKGVEEVNSSLLVSLERQGRSEMNEALARCV